MDKEMQDIFDGVAEYQTQIDRRGSLCNGCPDARSAVMIEKREAEAAIRSLLEADRAAAKGLAIYKDAVAFLIGDLKTIAKFDTLENQAALLKLYKLQLAKVEIILETTLQQARHRPLESGDHFA